MAEGSLLPVPCLLLWEVLQGSWLSKFVVFHGLSRGLMITVTVARAAGAAAAP